MESKIPCTACGSLILPSTFAKCNGLCMRCHKEKNKPEEYIPSKNIHKWLKKNKAELIPIIENEIRNDITALHKNGFDFYGYSIRPSCLYGSSNIDICSVYNCTSDINPEHKDNLYYRYCVSEWENFRYDGFDNSNDALQKYLNQYRELISSENNIDDEDHIDLFVDMTNSAIIMALKQVIEDGAFNGKSIFTIVWFADSQDDVVFESAKELNTIEIYKEFISEFG